MTIGMDKHRTSGQVTETEDRKNRSKVRKVRSGHWNQANALCKEIIRSGYITTGGDHQVMAGYWEKRSSGHVTMREGFLASGRATETGITSLVDQTGINR